MMSDWLSQYSMALELRDAREQAHKPYVDAYTKLADRHAAFGASTVLASTSPQPTLAVLKSGRPTTTSPTPPPNDLLTNLRADLATTQKARAALAAQVAELNTTVTTLRQSNSRADSEVSLLRRQKHDAERRLRDREEEIRGKARLVGDAQDEVVALEMQLNLAEQHVKDVEAENRELVRRWVDRMGEEVEKVNRENQWE